MSTTMYSLHNVPCLFSGISAESVEVAAMQVKTGFSGKRRHTKDDKQKVPLDHFVRLEGI